MPYSAGGSLESVNGGGRGPGKGVDGENGARPEPVECTITYGGELVTTDRHSKRGRKSLNEQQEDP
jgi:hypothetical protein